MPKRGSKPQAEERPPDELPGEALDLSSDEELADDELDPADGAEDNDSDAESLQSDEEEFRDAVAEYMAAAAAEQRPRGAVGDQEEAGPSGEEHDRAPRPVDPGSDSSEDERPNRNTVGNVPLVWYKDEDHIGYDIEGGKIEKRQRGDKLDALLARNDSRAASRTIYDEYNDEEIVLTKEELAMIMRIRKGEFPHLEVNPYEPYIDYYSGDVTNEPLLNNPVPKRRFIPSKWEDKKVVKLVRAIRKGWLKTEKEKRKPKQQPVYLLWADDGLTTDKTATGLSYIPAAKPKLPGHEESYNPPKEYIPTEEEQAGWQLMDPEHRPKFTPQAFDTLRHVPMYAQFIQERFDRCLDLYLCPRVRKKRMHIDPESLVPKLPKPQDLQPFPIRLAITYDGHGGRVRCIAPHPGGQWLASGSDDGSLRLWEVRTGRCMRTWTLGAPIHALAWCPDPALQLLSAAVDNRAVLLPSGLGGAEVDAAAAEALRVTGEAGAAGKEGAAPLAEWVQRADGGVDIVHRHPVKHVTWHGRGDYFASVSPTGSTQAVLVHQLSKRTSQNPFRKNKGRVVRVAFHPTKPFFFVATQNHVRIYNLAKQALAKKLIGGSGAITCLAVHPSGDHVIVGSEDKRLAWFDLDLSTTPYKALRYHTQPVRGAAFHPTYPLFASSADDGTCHIFHGMVYADLMTNPLIVPVKILRGHEVVDYSGVLDCAWHPTQPWVFTAGADGSVMLWTN